MKIREGFILRKIGDDIIVVPVGKASADFHGMIKLNNTAAAIWECIAEGKNEDEIVATLLDKYEVSDDDARKAVKATVDTLSKAGVLG